MPVISLAGPKEDYEEAYKLYLSAGAGAPPTQYRKATRQAYDERPHGLGGRLIVSRFIGSQHGRDDFLLPFFRREGDYRGFPGAEPGHLLPRPRPPPMFGRSLAGGLGVHKKYPDGLFRQGLSFAARTNRSLLTETPTNPNALRSTGFEYAFRQQY